MSSRRTRKTEFIDIAWCIAIFMVVLSHTAADSELLGDPPLMIKVVCSIGMPLLFCLSGLSLPIRPLRGWREWRLFLRRNLLLLGVPYLVWGLIYCRFGIRALGNVLYGSWQTLGNAGSVTALWYLPCLFWSGIIVQLVIGIMDRLGAAEQRTYFLIPAILLIAFGRVLPTPEIGYFWGLNVALTGAGCMLAGIVARRPVRMLSVRQSWIQGGLLAASLCIYVLAVISAGEGFVCEMLCRNYCGNPLNALLFAISGGAAVLFLAMLLKRAAEAWLPGMSPAPVLYLSRHTTGVYLLHVPLLQSILLPFLTKVFGEGHLAFVRIAAALVVMPVSIGLTRLIEYYVPELVGAGGNRGSS